VREQRERDAGFPPPYGRSVTVAPALLAALAGLGAGASLIIAIGAQNTFVLRQGLRREHVVAVVLVCTLSDVALIAAGVAGLGALVAALPVVVTVIRYAGALFLAGYAVLAARRAIRPDRLRADTGGAPASRRATALTALALTWLNPHVYLDTVLLLGGISAAYGSDRAAFAVGAALASALWFAGLGFGARLLAPVFARPAAWRVLDGVIAVVMLALAVTLVLGA
jgi:L-lysine exporter family protein LysE/ArgO